MRSGTDEAELVRLREEIRALQERVLNQVVEERIDADGAPVAFLTLSNQALLEATSPRA